MTQEQEQEQAHVAVLAAALSLSKTTYGTSRLSSFDRPLDSTTRYTFVAVSGARRIAYGAEQAMTVIAEERRRYAVLADQLDNVPAAAARLGVPPVLPEPEISGSGNGDDPGLALRLSFSQAVREIRDCRNLSQEALASRAGVDRHSISRWEQGLCAPTLDRLWSLADALGVPLSDLLRRQEEIAAGDTQCPRRYLGHGQWRGQRCTLVDVASPVHVKGHRVENGDVVAVLWPVDRADRSRWRRGAQTNAAAGCVSAYRDDAPDPTGAVSDSATVLPGRGDR